MLPGGLEVEAGLTLTAGELTAGHVAVDKIDKPIGGGVFLQSIKVDVKTDPDFELGGGAAITAGPMVMDKAAATLEGELRYTFADPDIFKVSGTLKVVDLELASGSIEYVMPDKVNMEGSLEFDELGLGVSGGLHGWIDGSRAFNIEGDATISAWGYVIGAKAVMSTAGMAACGYTHFFSDEITIGVGHKWGGDTDLLDTCDFGPYTEQALAGAGTYRVADGLPAAAFKVTGETAPPQFTLVGPNGERIDASENGSSPDAYLVITAPETNTTYVALARPAPGDWAIELHKESSPITSVRRSDGLPKAQVAGSVKLLPSSLCLTCPDEAVLSWDVAPIAGQTVTFVDISSEASRVIGTADGESGSITFTPGTDPTGKGQVVAVVEQDGLPRTNMVVATY